jgi:hypothetical protein
MLRQEELEFMKGMSKIMLPPFFPWELWKAVAVSMKKATAVFKANATFGLALEGQNGFGIEALNFRNVSQLPVSKMEAEELSSSDLSLSPPAAALRPGISSAKVPWARAPRANLLPRAASNSDRPRMGWLMLLYYVGMPARNSQIGRTSLQAKMMINLNPQPIGACLSETCPGL